MKIQLSLLFVMIPLVLNPAQAAEPLVLDKVLLQARDQNPELLAYRQAWKVKRAEIRPVGTWDNPTLSYVDERFPSGTDAVPNQKIQHYRIEQTIPFPGKLTGDARMKTHEALIAEADYRAKMLDVFSQVRMRYYQLYLTDQQLALANDSVEILKNALRSAQSRLASSQSSTVDVFMAQTELQKAENSQFELTQERHIIQLELNALLNQDVETVLGVTTPPDLQDLPLATADLQTLARHEAPLYLSAVHEIDHAKSMLTHNRLDFAPDFGVMYEHEQTPSGPAGRQIGVSMSFPLWFWKPWGNVRSAQEHVTEADAQSQAMQTMVSKMVAVESTEVTTHLTLSRRYLSGILPSAKSTLKIAQQRYASGQDDFMRLLEAYRMWISSNNEYQEELYHYGEHWSVLEQWLGVDLVRAQEALEQLKTMPEGHHD